MQIKMSGDRGCLLIERGGGGRVVQGLAIIGELMRKGGAIKEGVLDVGNERRVP